MKINPEYDGLSHINVYSKGKTELGRFLSNFAYSPIVTEDGPFQSIEGYWYWLGCKDDALRTCHGWAAKALGRELGVSDWQDSKEFKLKIIQAIQTKLETYPDKWDALRVSRLPLKHYYIFGTKVIEPREGRWILKFLSSYQGQF